MRCLVCVIMRGEGRVQEFAVNIVYSDKLVDYMKKKGYTHVELGVVEAGQCCSGLSEIFTGFLTEKGARRVEKKVVRRIPATYGDVLVTSRGLEYDDSPRFGLKSFLGVKDISVQGVRAWSL